jgi:predicted XRE-type DNA-binding protein
MKSNKFVTADNDNVSSNSFEMVDPERLNSFLEGKRISTTELAEMLGVTHAAVSLVRSGKNGMSMQMLIKMMKLFPDLCPKWMITGEGSPNCYCQGVGANREMEGMFIEIETLKHRVGMLEQLLKAKDEIIKLMKKSEK